MQTGGFQRADAPVGRELPEPAHLGSGDAAVRHHVVQEVQVRHGGIAIRGRLESDADRSA
jgi:hypothetical protein